MSGYTWMVSNLLFPAHERLKGHSTLRAFKAMEETQWLAPEALAQRQLADLKTFLSTIGKRVPYYRELFAKLGFDPADLDSKAGLRAYRCWEKPRFAPIPPA
ncbi:MAG: hypothetical protein R3E50_15970 [Halioglobus sp.]